MSEIKQEVTQETKVEEPTQEVKEDTQEQAQEEVKETDKVEKPEKETTKAKSSKNKPKAEKTKADKQETGKKATAKAEPKQEETKPEKELPPVKYKSLQSSCKNTAIHSLMLQVKNGKINLDHEVQRKGQQWGLENKIKLLESIISGVVINAIVVAELNGKKFCLDGKQRLLAIYSFVCDPKHPCFDPKLKVFGRSYAELDETERDAIDGANINVITYSNCSESDCFRLFEVYNNGVSLSASQKSKSYLSVLLINKINELLNSNFISKKCNITKGQLLKDEGITTIVQACMISSGFNLKSFNNKEIDRFLKETDERELLFALAKIDENIEILDSIVQEKNKNLKKIHLPMILACANDTEEFKSKLLNFLSEYDNESNVDIQNYRSHCQGSTSQRENVEGRLLYWKN